MVEKGESHANDGAGEETGKYELLLNLNLCQGARQVVDQDSEESNNAWRRKLGLHHINIMLDPEHTKDDKSSKETLGRR